MFGKGGGCQCPTASAWSSKLPVVLSQLRLGPAGLTMMVWFSEGLRGRFSGRRATVTGVSGDGPPALSAHGFQSLLVGCYR